MRSDSRWDQYLSEASLAAIRHHSAAQQQEGGNGGDGEVVGPKNASVDDPESPRGTPTWVDELSDLSAVAVKEYLSARS